MKKPTVFIVGLALGALIASGPAIVSMARWYFDERTVPAKIFADAELTRLPFDGNWWVSWGGENKTINHHYGASPQDLAIDIRKIVDGSDTLTMQGDPLKNESYGCWSQPIYAPIDGVVLSAVDGVPDNVPGELNNLMAGGNMVTLQSPEGFVVVLCHFKQGSVAVRAGQLVKAGELLALCGNSGRSTEPHLHMHVQTEASAPKSQALRMVFHDIVVGGIRQDRHSPRNGDLLSALTP